MRTSARTSMYKPNERNHVRAAFIMSHKHVQVRGLSHCCVHTPSLVVASCRHSRLDVRWAYTHRLQASQSHQTVPNRRFPWVSVRKCRDTVGSVRECTRTVGGVRTPHALCVRHLRYVCTHPRSYTIQTGHRRFLRCVYAIFRPFGCVGTQRGLEHAVGDGLARIADFGYFAQSAGSVSIRVPVWL